MLNISALLLFIFLSNENISYDKLKWSDFKEVSKLNDAVAESSTSIMYDYYSTGAKSNIKVYCLFNKNKSFVLNGEKTAYLLNHEQKHFDITYLYSLKLKNEFNKYNYVTGEMADEIYNKIISEWDAFENLYDLETDHSKNKEQQEVWDAKVSGLILEVLTCRVR